MLAEGFEPHTDDRRSRQWQKALLAKLSCPPQPRPTDCGHTVGRPLVPHSRPSGQPASSLPPSHHIVPYQHCIVTHWSLDFLILPFILYTPIITHLVVLWHWSQGWALSPTLGGLKTASPPILPLHQPLQLLHPLAQALNLGFHLTQVKFFKF